MEEKKIKLTCDLCGNRKTCNTRCTPVCAKFIMDAEAFLAQVSKETAKTEGLTWYEAERAAKEQGKCIRRKEWPKETFAWWRKDKVVTSDTNDPYIREVCRRTGFNKFPERDGFALVRYDSRYKGLPEISWWWVPHVDAREATDWEVFDVPNTYEDREVKVESAFEHIFRNSGKYSDKEILNLMKGIFPETFHRCRPRRSEIIMMTPSYQEFLEELHRVGNIMEGLDELLK